jgi:hypothetical protein
MSINTPVLLLLSGIPGEIDVLVDDLIVATLGRALRGLVDGFASPSSGRLLTKRINLKL